MSKRVFVSADWKDDSGNPDSDDKLVVERIRKWVNDGRYAVEFDCTDDVHKSVLKLDANGKVPADSDCRRCDIKFECGEHIDWSSTVIIVIGDKTATKSSGQCDGISCSPAYTYKAKKPCKIAWTASSETANRVYANESYIEHEIRVAVELTKKIILVFNSVYTMTSWIPSWYTQLYNQDEVIELCRVPFWNDFRGGSDCYQKIKEHLI